MPTAPGATTDWAYLIAATVFMFIFAVTLLVAAAMFVIRLVALAIIVMFSPVGFVGYIFPATSSFADKWWSALFKYSFFGPIMAFMMAVALQMMNAFGSASMRASMLADAQINVPAAGTAVTANWIAQAAFYSIPIIILWIAMGISQSMGIAGASAVVGSAKKWSNTALQGAKWAAFKNPVARGVKEGVKEKAGINRLKRWWESPSRIEAGVKGGIVGLGKKGDRFGFDNAGKKWGSASWEYDRGKIAELRKKWKDQGGVTDDELKSSLGSSDVIKARAAALEMAEKNGFKSKGESDADALKKFKTANSVIEKDPVLKNMFDDKVKEKHIKMIISTEIDQKNAEKMALSGVGLDPAEQAEVYKTHLDKLNSAKFADQKNIADDDKVAEYLKNKVTSAARNPNQRRAAAKFMSDVAVKMSDEDKSKLRENGAPL